MLVPFFYIHKQALPSFHFPSHSLLPLPSLYASVELLRRWHFCQIAHLFRGLKSSGLNPPQHDCQVTCNLQKPTPGLRLPCWGLSNLLLMTTSVNASMAHFCFYLSVTKMCAFCVFGVLCGELLPSLETRSGASSQ
jgi:hypothetical protein